MAEKRQQPFFESSPLTLTPRRVEQPSTVWSSFADDPPQQLSLVRALMQNDSFGFLCQTPRESDRQRWTMVVSPHDQAYAYRQQEERLSMLQASIQSVLEMVEEEEAEVDEISSSLWTDHTEADDAEAEAGDNQKEMRQ